MSPHLLPLKIVVNKFKQSARNSALIFHLNCVSVADYFLTALCLTAGNNMTLPGPINTSVLFNKHAAVLI